MCVCTGETVRSIFDLMDFTLSKNIPRVVIFIDFHKAFDSLEWNFFLLLPKSFNFGPDFIHWVEIFYKNIQRCIINNGCVSLFFALEHGVRQGDPLLEASQLMARKLNCYSIQMIQQQPLLTLAQVFFNLLDTLKLLSVLAINYSKTEGMWIGSCRNNTSKPFVIK